MIYFGTLIVVVLNNNLSDFGNSNSNAIASPPVQKSVDPLYVLETKLSYSSHAVYNQYLMLSRRLQWSLLQNALFFISVFQISSN